MSLLDDVLRLLGTSRTRLRWRWQATRARVARGRQALAPRARPAYAHKACPRCTHPAGADERVCTRCGAPLRSAAGERVARALGGIVPEGVPIVTLVVILVCVAMLLVTKQVEAELADVAVGGERAAFHDALVRLGGNVPWLSLNGQWWRLVTYSVLHSGGLLHLGMNGLAMWQAGSLVEERFGRTRAIVVYVATGIGGGLLSAWWHLRGGNPVLVSAGASGMAFGLMGVLLAHALVTRDAWARAIKTRLVPLVLWNVIISFVPGIDGAAHAGGGLAGALLGVVMTDLRVVRRRWEAAWRVLAVAALVVVVVAAAHMGGNADNGVYWLFGRPPS